MKIGSIRDHEPNAQTKSFENGNDSDLQIQTDCLRIQIQKLNPRIQKTNTRFY